MRMDRLTLKAQDALSRAQNEATNNNHYEIQPEHLLKALQDWCERAENSGVRQLQELSMRLRSYVPA